MGTIQVIGRAFQAMLEVRKQLQLLLKAPEGKTKVEKDEQRKKLSAIMEDLKATCKLVVLAETLKEYKLICCFVVGKAHMQWDKIMQETHCKDLWIGVNGQSHNGICVQSWLSFRDCIKLHTSLPSFLLMPPRSSVSTCRRQSRNPSRSL